MDTNTVVFMSSLSSAECFKWDSKEPVRVLHAITLDIYDGEIWGITARSAYEIRLLLEIMGNIRPYDGGKCVLLQKGMMRTKRVVQPHLFYIGTTDMLYENMNALEYLMFVTAHMRKDRISMQEELFECLLEMGLGELSLSGIRWFSAEEKAIVALIAAAYSDCRLIIINSPDAVFGEQARLSLSKIAKLVTQRGKTLVIGTLDCELIQTTCTHTAFIANGRVLYKGTTDTLCREYDKVAVILRDGNIAALAAKLSPMLPACRLQEKNGALLIKADAKADAHREIYQTLLTAGIIPQDIRINKKNVCNAYEELMRQNDLPEQLF